MYCDNNPVVRVDEDGAVWQLALAGGGTMATGSLVAGLGAITPAGWAAIIIGVVIIASIAIVKKRNSKLQIGNKLQICRTKNKTLYAKSKGKQELMQGEDIKKINASQRKIVMKKETLGES